MIQSKLMTTLTRSISNVLETMFFLPIRVEEDDPAIDEWMQAVSNPVGAQIGFTGPFSGQAFFILSENVVMEMTANFLGLSQEEATSDQQQDTLKEALNMIAGHMLSLYDTKGEIQLGIPELMTADDITDTKQSSISDNTLLIATENSRMISGIVAAD
jgi:CheY-specific phosphatase CheX